MLKELNEYTERNLETSSSFLRVSMCTHYTRMCKNRI